MQKRGQSWSIELIISLSVFVVIIIGLFVSFSTQPTNPVQELQAQSQQFISRFFATDTSNQQVYSFIENNNVNDQKLAQLQATDYSEIKKELGLSDDFCIILVDSNNNIIPIVAANGSTYYAIGSGNIQLGNGVTCNSTVS